MNRKNTLSLSPRTYGKLLAAHGRCTSSELFETNHPFDKTIFVSNVQDTRKRSSYCLPCDVEIDGNLKEGKTTVVTEKEEGEKKERVLSRRRSRRVAMDRLREQEGHVTMEFVPIKGKAFGLGSNFPPLKKDFFRLYSMRFCPFSQRARLVLAWKKISHEIVNINLSNKPDWFVNLTLAAETPVLQINDIVLSESTAVCEWLDNVYSTNRLQPANHLIQARDRMLLEYFRSTSLQITSIIKNKQLGNKEDSIQLAIAGLDVYASELDARGGDFFGGRRPSMLDIYVFPFIERVYIMETSGLLSGMQLQSCLDSWLHRMLAIAAVRACATNAEHFIEFYHSFRTSPKLINFDAGLEQGQRLVA